ncbi:signal recognition particle-docking protein FtsY [Parvularcula sp. LCG005]|uniref:signal recognition particle-docking protein FtsY n=1 Tax=Parvularcula sp. LCG005 TaxID=3078805 RepID=UPI0029422D07|nr:signal recognition particle-docking protein FtsY [Parvularcula sp. LCG005]WOI53399.1 signal recognition particle-docking protein FtsY [Parvularcula sp. LCG005]
MAEKKGLFSRWFGKKDEAPDNLPEDAPEALTETTPEPAAPEPDPAPPSPPPADIPEEPEETPPPPPVEEPPPPAPEAPPVIDEPPAEDPVPPVDEPLDEPAPAPVIEEPVAIVPHAPVPNEPPSVPQEPLATPEPEEQVDAPVKKRGLFSRLTEGLSKTSVRLTTGIGGIFTKRKLDDATLEELEDLLITADLGLPATTRIITHLTKSKYDQEVTNAEVRQVLAAEISRTLTPLAQPLTVNRSHKPHIILMTGVNGAGKTTTIGKLARKFADDGLSVLLAAGDTFRAAAIEQLQVWGERTGAQVVARAQGADAAGLAYDAIEQARRNNIDVVMIDTAGRLQNRSELMDELAKIVRVIKKLVPDAPHDTLLVLDATVGQNALSQAEAFTQIAGVSGLVMTKLDGTARGGVLVALGDKFALPIHYIGVGEAVEDLQPFNADDFASALTAADKE